MRRTALLALAGLPALAAAQDCSPQGYSRSQGDHNGYGVVSSGRGGAIHIADSAHPPLRSMTVEVFFKADTLPSTARLISCKSPTDDGGWAMSLVDGHVRFEFFTGLAVQIPDPIVTGTWYRAVANVSDEGNSTLAMNLYLGRSTDDVLYPGEVAWGSASAGPTAGGLHLMADPSGSNRFFGVIEEARVYSPALGAATVGYISTPGINGRFEHNHDWAAYTVLHFTEGSGPTIADASGHGRDGSLAAVSWVPLFTDSDGNGVLDICQSPCLRGHTPDQRVCAGTPVTLQVDVGCTAGAGLGVQWIKDGAELSGQNGEDLDFPAASRADEGVYQARCWNLLNPALSILTDPTVLTVQDDSPQPPSATVSADRVCAGVGTIVLEAPGFHAPFDFELEWHAGSCDGPVIGTGARLEVPAPTVDTAYFVRSVGRCGVSACTATPVVHAVPSAGGVEVRGVDGVLTRDPGGSMRRVVASNFGLALTEDGSLHAVRGGAYLATTPPPGPFVDIGCSEVAGYGIRADGTAAAWGTTNSGELTVPPGAWRSIAGGIYWSVGVHRDGTLEAWGTDSFNAGVLTPPPGRFLSAAGAGYNTGVAVREDGALVAWGDDRLGMGITRVPQGTFTKVVAVLEFAMALRTDGSIAVWSDRLGGTDIMSPPPGPFVDLIAGSRSAAAQRPDGRWVVWGAGARPPADRPIDSVALLRDGTSLAISTWPITALPAPARARRGDTVELAVTLDPTATIDALEWRHEGTVIPGANGPVLRLTASPETAGSYQCTATTACGRATTHAVAVTLDCPADFNRDGFTDFFDYDDFVAAFESGDPAADFNRDGFLDFFDDDGFVLAFENGC